MDGEKYLIKVVKLNPAIWNKKLFDYSDNELKNIIWLKIAKKFNMDGEDCLHFTNNWEVTNIYFSSDLSSQKMVSFTRTLC